MAMKLPDWIQSLRYNAEGLIPAIVQDADREDVLMMAWMNEEALKRTLACREMVFWSRSRKEFWHKGETSGNVMEVVEFAADCDFDTLLFKVRMRGPQAACHTGARSCFFNMG